jgi:hypothetical protein
MTVEKAITVATVVFWVTRYFALQASGGGPAACRCENDTAILA